MKKKIVFTVTNDLLFDQRMGRICTSVANSGYEVLLVGRLKRTSNVLKEKPYGQKRLFCFFQKGKLFYIEYNIRLFFYLLFLKTDCICAIDLDTILPCLFVSKLKNTKRVYDAHELFCEMEEIVSRPFIYRMWKRIEKFAVPKFKDGYTIGYFYKEEFAKMYGVQYEIIRNATVLQSTINEGVEGEYILYQGAVNEGRSFETLIPAMQFVDCILVICGEGNYFEQAQQLVKEYNLQHKIFFKGYVEPQELVKYTQCALLGITLFTNKGWSNYYSLANRYFDYMHYGIPQVCTAYPEYIKINETYEVAVLAKDTSVEEIASCINTLLQDKNYRDRLKQNCFKARQQYCWQVEEKKLIHFYTTLFER